MKEYTSLAKHQRHIYHGRPWWWRRWSPVPASAFGLDPSDSTTTDHSELVMLRLFGGYVLGWLALVAPAAAQCSREMLVDTTDAYVAAQETGDVSAMTLADDVAYLENYGDVAIDSGLLAQGLAIDHSRSTHDTTLCATYTELIITDPSHPYVIGTQMQVAEDGSVTQISSIVTDDGDWLFDAEGTLQYASQETWDPIPEDQRDTRETIQAAGDAYLDLFNDKSVEVPWGTPCARLEGGMYTGQGNPDDSCNVGVPDGLDLTNRRYVIDETLGTVDVFLNFGGPSGMPDSHEFRVENGKLRYVHTMTVME
ncbi:hypothetical protein BDY21DRAFT_42054 [Lineolata rhizophorae]|uniref:DUF8021 domain-containing protein n=1 Tax=Lineolata rhizophorae TaxID=578093 RepID=A0A6A6NZU4_9PEZI|nr:hypothetical protein BDY21DRAFT_42054 [Lineolata rhizophorae]